MSTIDWMGFSHEGSEPYTIATPDHSHKSVKSCKTPEDNSAVTSSEGIGDKSIESTEPSIPSGRGCSDKKSSLLRQEKDKSSVSPIQEEIIMMAGENSHQQDANLVKEKDNAIEESNNKKVGATRLAAEKGEKTIPLELEIVLN